MSERAVIGRWESDSDAPHCVTPYGSSAHPATVVRLMSVWPYPDHKHGAHGLHPTRNDMRMTRIAGAFTGITAGFLALAFTLTPGANATPRTNPTCTARALATPSAARTAVVIDMRALRRCHGADAQMIIGFTDTDGKPGGAKRYRVELDLP